MAFLEIFHAIEAKRSLQQKSIVIYGSATFQVFVALPLWPLKGRKNTAYYDNCRANGAVAKIVKGFLHCSGVSRNGVCTVAKEASVAATSSFAWMVSITCNFLQLYLLPCGYHVCSCNHCHVVFWEKVSACTVHYCQYMRQPYYKKKNKNKISKAVKLATPAK